MFSWEIYEFFKAAEVFWKKVFLKISQYSQEKACVGVCFC